MIARRVALGLACLVSLGAASPATRPAPKPDFSGTWKLDTLRSEFGNFPGGRWRERVDVIRHREPHLLQTLYLDRESGRDTTVYRYTTDGKATVNRVDKQDIRATVTWDGNALRLLSKTRIGLLEMSLDDRWALSPDRKTLTMTRRVKYPMGEGVQKLVFGKQ